MGGALGGDLTSNLPSAPANSMVVDPEDAASVYIATDAGVFSTRQVASCGDRGVDLLVGFWRRIAGSAGGGAERGSEQLVRDELLTAATYGRGVWEIPQWTWGASSCHGRGESGGTDVSERRSEADRQQRAGPVTLDNTGSVPLTITGIAVKETVGISAGRSARAATLNRTGAARFM